jgi:PAS domain S-box-containing protein
VLNGEAVQHFDTVRRRKDGTLIDVSLTISPILTAVGQILGVSGIARDISERRRVEEEMKRSEEKFSKLFQDSPEALTLTRASDHSYVDVNKAFERTTGWHRDEVIGKTAFDIHLWINQSDRFNLVTEILAGKALRNHEVRYRRKDGTEGIALASADLIQIEGESCVLSGFTDITERKRAEQERQLFEGRFRQFFETIPEYAYMVSPTGELIDVNPAACSALGYTKDELVGKPLSIIYAPECRSRAREIFAKWEANGKLRNEEMVVITKQGQRRVVLVNVGSIKDSDGNILHSASVHVDITERQRAEEALKRSEEKFLKLFHGSPAAVALSRLKDGLFFEVNDTFERLFGYRREEVIGGKASDIGVWVDLSQREELTKRLLSERCVRDWEVPLRTKNGDILTCSVSTELINIGNEPCILSVTSNITEGKLAAEALRASEERFRSLFDNATVGIYRTTPGGRILASNPTLIRMLGYQDFESLATRNLEEKGFEPSYQRRVFCDRMEREGKVIGLESAWTKQDGSVIFVRESARGIRGPDGKILYYDGIVEDITARKREEEALLESEARFNQLAERSRTTTWEVDTQGLFTFVSHVSEVVWGYSPDELVGRMHFYDLHPEEGREEFKAAVFAVTERREPFENVVHAVKTKDGRITWGSVNGFPMLHADGTLQGYRGSCTDITERQRAEEALRRSEEKFLKLFQGSPAAVALSSVKDGRFIEVNNTFERFFGYRREEVIGRIVSDIGIWVDPSQGEELTKRLLSEQSVRDWELCFRTKSGDILTCLVSTELIEVGNEPCILSVTSDITERKLAEEALHSSEERFRLAAQAGKMFAYEWDVRSDVIIRSPQAAQILGMGEGERITGQQIMTQVHSDDQERLTAAISTLCPESPDLQISYRITRPDGSLIWVERNSRASFDERGRILRVVGMVRDITERKLAEEALRESEEQFRALAEAIPQLCWMARGDGYIFWYNQRWFTYTGKNQEQMEGWGWQSVHDPQILPSVLERWTASISTAEPFDMVFPLRGVDGVYRPFLTRIMPVKDADGRVVRWFGTNTDITEIRDAQEALSNMTRKLIEAQEQERARIARELHDDINQRLAIMAIELDHLRANHLPPEILDNIQKLQQKTIQISADVQAISHDLHSSNLEYLGVVDGMRSWCGEFGQRHGIEIEFKYGGLLKSLTPEISLCLFRILQEALHNTAKHARAKRVEVQLREESGVIELVIRDSGRGFDIKAAKRGRGLGLTSMQERVRLVGGTFEIDSMPLIGTTIQVRVPAGVR